MKDKKIEADQLRLEGARFLRHADALEKETRLLKAKGYYDATGRPIGGEKGKKIWDQVQAELRAARRKARP